MFVLFDLSVVFSLGGRSPLFCCSRCLLFFSPGVEASLNRAIPPLGQKNKSSTRGGGEGNTDLERETNHRGRLRGDANAVYLRYDIRCSDITWYAQVTTANLRRKTPRESVSGVEQCWGFSLESGSVQPVSARICFGKPPKFPHPYFADWAKFKL